MSSHVLRIRKKLHSKLRRYRTSCIRAVKNQIHFFDFGRRGERAARRYLERRGFYIRHSNWVCEIGEIDLVAQKRDQLIFVEVKSRLSRVTQQFSPVEAVDAAKMEKIRRLADWYSKDFSPDIRYRRLRHQRFDIVAVVFNSRWGRAKIEHYANAF